jgi:hypothetical protein
MQKEESKIPASNLNLKKLISYYDKGAKASSATVPQKVGGDSMRMSVWDMDSEESDMSSDDDKAKPEAK